jgi:RNA polymerase primary sigma factor
VTQNNISTSFPGDAAIELYLREFSKRTLLTPQAESALAARLKQGDQEAREKLIKANLGLVVKIAREHEGLGLPLLDLISEGNLGLLQGVGRFDPANEGELAACASLWIKRSIARALATHSQTIPPLGSPARPMKSRMGRIIRRLTPG